jgi:hypothetical protein
MGTVVCRLAFMIVFSLWASTTFAQSSPQQTLSKTQPLHSTSGERNHVSLSEVWPDNSKFSKLTEIGKGKGVVFSPDLSVPTNRLFYERLGFAYFENASWSVVIDRLKQFNRLHPTQKIEVLIIESHGTNGNGLKLQEGHGARSPRSYISVGGLQEKLASIGVRLCIVTACNAGRLFRPQIYRAIDRHTRDPLFLPATMGYVDASPRFDPAKTTVRIAYPAKSGLETINYGDTAEFAVQTRSVLGNEKTKQVAAPWQHGLAFTISDILAQLLIRDPQLKLNTTGFVTTKSSQKFADAESEAIYQRFLKFIDHVAATESQINQIHTQQSLPQVTSRTGG